MPESSHRPLVLLIAAPAALGGSNRSVANFMASLRPHARCVLASPGDGKFLAYVRERDLVEEHIPLPHGNRFKRLLASAKIALWAFRHRRQISVIHAQATTGLNLAMPAAVITRLPVVARVSDPEGSKAGKLLGPMVRWLVPRLTVVPVSETARAVAVVNGLCREDEAIIVPEPVVLEDVVAIERQPVPGVLTIGFLGGLTFRKGADLLPTIVDGVADLPVRWVFFMSASRDSEVDDAVVELLASPTVEFHGRESDVRKAYAMCDIVFVPSRSESFCLVVAEAMANGIPVVASDLDPIKRLLGAEEAGLMFPNGDAQSATNVLRRLIDDGDLRQRLGDAGRVRATAYSPDGVFQQLAPIYGIKLD